MKALAMVIIAALAVQWGILIGLGLDDSTPLLIAGVAGLVVDAVTAVLVWRFVD